ncbi:hypothetical protein [Bradyrhizobium retamae]|uniref:hypothetical protein n=1 Tax=Bradyrhizobium retamae TaxID=1300035 RepID=UPI0012E34453|nr:hypothetical protein [Bradyrhizobium retamae]
MNVASSFTYLPESQANAMFAGDATFTNAVTAPSAVLVFSLNVQSCILSAQAVE